MAAPHQKHYNHTLRAARGNIGQNHPPATLHSHAYAKALSMTARKPAPQSAPPLIVVLATGGTIAGRSQGELGGANYRPGAIGAGELLAGLPGMDAIARLRYEQVANIGSEDMMPEVWFSLAAHLRREMADAETAGVVILHGTDTMEETAFFLDLIGDWKKPVVMTGAMRPADAPSADGPMNILDAVRTAVAADSAGRGVLVAMNGVIHAARDVAKTDTLNLDAFRSRGGGSEGRMVDSRPVYFRSAGRDDSRVVFDIGDIEELPRVEILYGHAGQRRELVDAALAAGAWGIVHAGVGMGNVHAAVRPALIEAARGGMAVVCSSRVPGGPSPKTDRNRLDGFISAGELNPQKARVLLQLALTRTNKPREIQAIFDSMP